MSSALSRKAARAPVAKASRSRTVRVKAAMEANYLPGNPRPAYLNGSLAGDFGFDPLGLGKDPDALKWYQQAELLNGRTAMTAVAGIVLPGLATKIGVLSVPEWYDAGKVYYEGSDPIPFATLLMVQLFMTHFVEVKRWQDMRESKSQGEKGSFFGLESTFAGSGETGYPGGAFDPMGLGSGDAKSVADWRLKEIKNARLAMMAFLGFIAQHAATGKGPIDNLFDHISDPFHNNFAENGVSIPF